MNPSLDFILIGPIAFADLEDKLLARKRFIATALADDIHHYVNDAEEKDPSFLQGQQRWDGEMGELESGEVLPKSVPRDVGITIASNIQQWLVEFDPTGAVLALSQDTLDEKAVEAALPKSEKVSIKSITRCQEP
jgi:hypothetical protein